MSHFGRLSLFLMWVVSAYFSELFRPDIHAPIPGIYSSLWQVFLWHLFLLYMILYAARPSRWKYYW